MAGLPAAKAIVPPVGGEMPRSRSRSADRSERHNLPSCSRRRSATSLTPLSYLLLPSLLSFASSGCMVGPDYQAPSVATAQNYLEANQASVDTKRQEYEAWWRVFKDPVLDRLVEAAYNQNLTLVAAGTRVLQALAELGIAIGDFYPQSQKASGSLIYERPSRADPLATPQSQGANFW